MPLSMAEPVAKLSCGTYFNAAITAAGVLYVWGRNKCGNLALGDTQHRHAPTLVEGILTGRRVIDVGCGFHHMVVITEHASKDADGSSAPEPVTHEHGCVLRVVYVPMFMDPH